MPWFRHREDCYAAVIEGTVELSVPLPKGTRVTVPVVKEREDDFGDLVLAAKSSLDFWNNSIDDEAWNNA